MNANGGSRKGSRRSFFIGGALLLAACAAPLQRAIRAGDSQRVTLLMDQGAERRESFGNEMTPLKVAVMYHRAGIVRLLLARGADVNERRGGASALNLAATQGDLAMAQLLLSLGAKASSMDEFWIPGPDREKIRALLQADIEARQARAAAAAAEAPPPLAVEHSGDFALVVGVETYSDAPAARFAESDAEAVSKSLIALGWPSRNVLLLSGQRAGRAGLERYLERWLPANAGKNSKFFFYFAGDGAVDPKTGTAYLLPWDGDASLLEQTAYSLPRLYERLDALGAGGAVAVIDAGFSGSGGRTAAGPGGAALSGEWTASEAGSGRSAVILAAAPGEGAGVSVERGHGLLTEALLANLDAADPKPETFENLFDAVRTSVSGQAVSQGRTQTPRLLAGSPESSGLRIR